uniref:tRNA (uracil-O(2)-)-methyltransferase n=1 Tax=Acrobeloides nanus TaxID=290746 RepID=A0A914CD46_9BILA
MKGLKKLLNWTEKTDPQKFVFEDCAIASYLIELWRNNHGYPNQFVDMGCGNGLLVYLLANEKINGIGVDVRKRNIWANFRNVADLREIVLDPSSVYTGLPDGTDFLIGNHSDELTPWIPIIAARLKCRFFLLPCCPFDLFGKFSKRGSNCIPFAEDLGKFGQYFTYIHSIITKLGFDVKLDRLKIPSTKRLCFVGSLPENGLPENIEERILEIINAAKNVNKEFIPRLKVEQVRNCSLLPTDLRTNLTKKIFDYLLNLSLERIGDWRCGGSEKLVDIIKTLTGEEKEHLRQQNGGLQTFIKNQHQVFTVRNGSVGIRKWPLENGEFLSKQKDIRKSECWFFRNHPDGCPVSTEKCAFRH